MKIGVLGSGKMGLALGAALARQGHDVIFGTRDRARVSERLRERRLDAPVASHRDAVRVAQLVVLATRWEETESILAESAPFDGKVVLSCVGAEGEHGPIVLDASTSAAEEIARWAPTARVVEAFNATYSEFVDLSPQPPGAPTVLYCGDNSDAKSTVRTIIEELGFDPLDSGPLANARQLEALTRLVIYFVRKAGYGPLGIHPQWIINAPASYQQ